MPSEMTDIIVVDDNQVLLSVIAEIFKECGYTVRTATDGFAALAQIRRKVPHVLLSDLDMHERDLSGRRCRAGDRR
jgi:CheY-like chemotaxis protein